ncbi:TonB-dependent receptor domain-containing protein [Thioalkalivibrio sp. AKL6]|uniref:TonB-dependent receptor domain-containing protein n=1 Tax=Thioalkalivibrio sp. AKL6 TaxID=1158154 RepID=UPI00035F0261|nr:TonB-dependent receptor [Thioalkalivibrio sp. AKL6]
MKRTALSTAILLAMTPALAHAQDAPETEARTLDTVQVTATRVAQTVDETLASVTIIDREEIERLQPQQFTDVLQGRAGLSVVGNGPFGKTTSVFMRGTSSDHHLLLVDGVRMGSATSGGASWQFLPPEEIERVEIVRGPRTSIYGSDAIGGVTQVFTREGRRGPPEASAFLGGGSFGTRELGVGVAGGTDDTSYRLSMSHFSTDGIDVQDGFGDDDRDGYDNTSLSGKVSHRLDNGIELFGNLLYSEGATEFDGTPDQTDFLHAVLQGGLRIPILDRWDTELAYAQSRDEGENFAAGTFFSTFDTRRDQLTWRNDIQLGDRTDLIAGVDAYEDRVSSTTDYDEDSRYNVGVYSVLRSGFGAHDLEGSLRLDDNEQFGDKVTGQVAWGMQATEALRLRASYGTAFKAPTFNELFFPGFGNPDLEPEESETLEVGARYAASQAYVDVAVFETRVDELIDNQMVGGVFMPINVDEARIRGLEIEGGHEFGPWNARASLTLLDAKDRNTGNELRRRPPVSGRFDLDRQVGDFSLGGTVLARGRSYNDGDNEERLSGHGLLDLRAAYAIDAEWSVLVTVKNVFDRDYVVARDSFNEADYNQPGRAAFVKLRYQQR